MRYAWLVVKLLVPVLLLNDLECQMLATMKAAMVLDIPGIANKADWAVHLVSGHLVDAACELVPGACCGPRAYGRKRGLPLFIVLPIKPEKTWPQAVEMGENL